MAMEDPIARWHVYFSGDVQGVGFRFTAQYYAERLGLTGWVRNLPDDRVEMEVQGPVSRLRLLMNQLQKHPPIRISSADIQELPLKQGEKKLSIIRF